MDCTPDPHYIKSRQSQKLSWSTALSELIDNSFDANAKRVTVEFAGKYVTVQDDGDGAKSIDAMIRLGHHEKHGSTKLGRYGVGLKDAWLWCSDAIEIVTVRRDLAYRFEMDYEKDLKVIDGRWVAPDPTSTPAAGRHGTNIKLGPVRRTLPSRDLIDSLSTTFAPALSDGLQIVVKLRGKIHTCNVPQLPPFVKEVADSFEVHGRSVDIRIGIIQDGHHVRKSGFQIHYGHRCIDHSTIGSGQFSCARMYGVIKLGRGWRLTTHKDDLDEYKEELADAIFDRIQPLLAEAERLSHDLQSEHLRNLLEQLLNDSVGKREKRDKGDTTGTVEPKNTGSRRRRAQKVNNLSGGIISSKRRRKHGWKIDWTEIDGKYIGDVDALNSTVQLNTANAYIDKAKAEDNIAALYGMAMAMICHHETTHDGTQKLLTFSGDFTELLGVVLGGLDINKEGASCVA